MTNRNTGRNPRIYNTRSGAKSAAAQFAKRGWLVTVEKAEVYLVRLKKRRATISAESG